MDDSDTYSRPSNLTIYQDGLTGCEYLGNGHGIIQRFDRDGKQICRELGAPWKLEKKIEK